MAMPRSITTFRQVLRADVRQRHPACCDFLSFAGLGGNLIESDVSRFPVSNGRARQIEVSHLDSIGPCFNSAKCNES
jgi:hypothetical protein